MRTDFDETTFTFCIGHGPGHHQQQQQPKNPSQLNFLISQKNHIFLGGGPPRVQNPTNQGHNGEGTILDNHFDFRQNKIALEHLGESYNFNFDRVFDGSSTQEVDGKVLELLGKGGKYQVEVVMVIEKKCLPVNL